MLTIKGTVINRSGGREFYSASQVMNRHPKWKEFIRSISGWDKVEDGTLTLDECSPLPNVALDQHVFLAKEPPPEHFFEGDQKYIDTMKERGGRRFYRGTAKSAHMSCAVLVSQQKRPACEHRLEVYAKCKLREVLNAETGDSIWVEIDSNQEPLKS